jgi:hypothetical protein
LTGEDLYKLIQKALVDDALVPNAGSAAEQAQIDGKTVKDASLLLADDGIKGIKYREFQLTRDSRTSTTGGEGISVFNEHKSHAEKYLEGRNRTFRLEFLEKASRMYRLAIAAIHLCGGPSPRGTEEAVIRLLNSRTEAVRNVQMMQETVGIENG